MAGAAGAVSFVERHVALVELAGDDIVGLASGDGFAMADKDLVAVGVVNEFGGEAVGLVNLDRFARGEIEDFVLVGGGEVGVIGREHAGIVNIGRVQREDVVIGVVRGEPVVAEAAAGRDFAGLFADDLVQGVESVERIMAASVNAADDIADGVIFIAQRLGQAGGIFGFIAQVPRLRSIRVIER